MKNPDPLEKDIEKRVCDYAKSLKMLCYKFTSPSRRSVPDRMFITERGVVFFIEFKRKGQKPTAAQWVEIKKIQATEVTVAVVDNVGEGKNVITSMELMHGPKDDLESNKRILWPKSDPLSEY